MSLDETLTYVLLVHVGLSTGACEQIKNTSSQVVALCLVRKLKFYGRGG